jgi:hypothetical protein
LILRFLRLRAAAVERRPGDMLDIVTAQLKVVQLARLKKSCRC